MSILNRKNRKAEVVAPNGAKVQAPELDLLLGKDDTVDVTEQIKAMDDLDNEIETLGKVVDADKAKADHAERKAMEMAEFELSPKTSQLLDAAMLNVASNNGMGIEDEKVRAQIAERAALIAATECDLPQTIGFIVDAVKGNDAVSTIYSLCFAIQKAANFTANLWYRTALDPRDGEGTPAHDHREQQEPPYGLGAEDARGDAVMYAPEEEVLAAYVELHDYLQLVTEAFGWDPERPMPFAFLQEKDGRFTPITDAEQALDYMEVRRQQSRAKRVERQTANLSAALAAAKKTLLNAGKRKAATA